MESPVRICLGAVLVVNLLLSSGTPVTGSAVDASTTVKYDGTTKYVKANATWPARGKQRTPDVALNELQPRESVSEEHTEKNAKYKHRGRVRFNTLTSTERSIRRTRTSARKPVERTTEHAVTVKPTVFIVTPTPEIKKPAQIIDSMRTYKKTKMTGPPVSSTAPTISKEKTDDKSEEEYEDDDEKENLEKYSSSKYYNSNFFTDSGFNGNSKEKTGKNKLKSDYSYPFDSYSTYFPKSEENFNKFFHFESDLTTPKNDFFDKKYEEIASSIIKNLDSIKAKPPPIQNQTLSSKKLNENVGFDKFHNGTPSNKSTVFFKNTKEIRVLDNDGAGSSNKELSDVQGTSIYYEMSMLSTETYAINNSNEDDCDEASPSDANAASSEDSQISNVKSSNNIIPAPTKPSYPDPATEATISSFLPYSSPISTFLDSVSPISFSSQNTYLTTEKNNIVSRFNSRNRGYSKRLNFTESKESPNSVTSRAEQAVQNSRTRKFHYTTPKTKPIWMAPPRRNGTRYKPSSPTTIYSEHFDISDKLSTTTSRPRQPTRTVLTTVSSTDIDPVLQGDISGDKKVVHSNSISDNSIPSLWKRGSTKYSSSTVTSAEVSSAAAASGASGVSDLEIPPTLTAWALASLRSTPSLGSSQLNATRTTQKNADENELQKVGEVIDIKEATVGAPSISTTAATNLPAVELTSQKIVDIDQNKLHWRPVHSPKLEEIVTSTEARSERLPAESNISEQSSREPASTTESIKIEQKKIISDKENLLEKAKGSWVPATNIVTTMIDETTEHVTIPPVDATKSTGFESITKLPSGITTPRDEIKKEEIVSEYITIPPTTTDYEITTIRFTYVPTMPSSMETHEEESTTQVWHHVPTRTRMTTIEDGPITTYRPQHHTSTEIEEETTFMPETTSQIEVSSQITEKTTESEPNTTETVENYKTEEATSETILTTTTRTTTTVAPMVTTSAQEDTTTVAVEVVTEINSEKEHSTTNLPIKSTEAVETSSEIKDIHSSSEENSGSNEVINQETTKMVPPSTTVASSDEPMMLETAKPIVETKTTTTTTEKQETTTQMKETVSETTVYEDSNADVTTDSATKSVNDLEDLSNYNGEMTTEASSRVLPDEAGSGAAIAIAVSTIGVIALILLVGLLLVVRRRGRRGVYAQRCTPVSLDAYSLDSVSVGQRKGNQRLRASKRSYGNPAYDDEVTSHPMQYAALANFALDVESITQEFAEIPTVSVRPEDVPPGCEDKNRYSNVLPLPETRVPLTRIGNDPTTEYINANFITGPGNIRNYYILCQAPLANTVADFWRMMWEHNSRVIVMLTEYMENGVEKCYEYLPPSEISDNRRTFGDFQIILKKREQRDKYAISCVQLINLRTRTWREITHLWYFWPAKGVPDDYDSVIDFLGEMRGYMKMSQTAKEYDEEGIEVIYEDQNRSSYNNLSKLRSEESATNGVNVYSPARAEEQMRRNFNNGTLGRMKAASEIEGVRSVTVVCASGAGRGGALVALDAAARALAAGRADLPRLVRQLRAQRPHALSNKHHYIFLYKVLSEYGRKLMGENI